MGNSLFSNFLKILPSYKTGQRFGGRIDKTKKVGLFSERRFLIFTKRGPIEITFKPIHYSTAFLSLLVGFTSIIYWSAIGIYSAIDVAEKNIITEASATFVVKQRQNKNNNLNERFHFKSYLNSYESTYDTDKNSQSNILLPKKYDSELIKKDFLTNSPFKTNNPNKYPLQLESENYFFAKPNNKKIRNEKKITSSKSNNIVKNANLDLDIENKIFEKSIANEDYSRKITSKINKDKDRVKDKKNKNEIFLPPVLDEQAKNYRFITSLDYEIKTMQEAINSLKIKVTKSNILKVEDLKKLYPSYDPSSLEYLDILKERLSLLSIYKNALEFIPLKPPMRHYYVTSNYGNRKHPVTKKWAFHHGIDLAGTWQENINVTADGIVIFAGYHGSFGKVIRIQHNYGIKTTYGHLAKIKVKKGDIVTDGQVIGKMGRTGRVAGAHLHYEISVNGKSIDPAKFFKVGRQLINRNTIRSVEK